MAGRKPSPKMSVIPCKLLPEVNKSIEDYAADLKRDGWKIGSHGLSKKEFEN